MEFISDKGVSHYEGRDGLKAVEVMESFAPNEEWVKGFYWCNIIKYTLRYRNKDGLKDLKKAKDYIEWLIDAEEASLEEGCKDV